MYRFTFPAVWLLTTAALVVAVYGGPVWAYPVAVIAALVGTGLLVAYPSDNSLRRTLAGLGLLFLIGPSIELCHSGFTPLTLHDTVPFMLFGVACLVAAIAPLAIR